MSRINTSHSAVVSVIRLGRGWFVSDGSRPPMEPVELFEFEACPYCRKVREALQVLNLDHKILNVARRSARRPELVARGGKMKVPYLIDPNTGVEMYESEDIVAYLHRTYADGASPGQAMAAK